MHELANTVIMYQQGTVDYRSLISLTSTTTAQTSVCESTIQIIENIGLNGKMFGFVFDKKCGRYLESIKYLTHFGPRRNSAHQNKMIF